MFLQHADFSLQVRHTILNEKGSIRQATKISKESPTENQYGNDALDIEESSSVYEEDKSTPSLGKLFVDDAPSSSTGDQVIDSIESTSITSSNAPVKDQT